MADTSASSVLRDCLMKAKAGDSSARNRLFAACRSYLGLMARTSVEPWMSAKLDNSDVVQQTMLDADCEVIILRNMQRLSFADVAERLGRTRSAAQMLWMRAIQNLKSRLLSAESGEFPVGAAR